LPSAGAWLPSRTANPSGPGRRSWNRLCSPIRPTMTHGFGRADSRATWGREMCRPNGSRPDRTEWWSCPAWCLSRGGDRGFHPPVAARQHSWGASSSSATRPVLRRPAPSPRAASFACRRVCNRQWPLSEGRLRMPDISCSRLLKRLDRVSFSISPHWTFSAGTRSMRSSQNGLTRWGGLPPAYRGLRGWTT